MWKVINTKSIIKRDTWRIFWQLTSPCWCHTCVIHATWWLLSDSMSPIFNPLGYFKMPNLHANCHTLAGATSCLSLGMWNFIVASWNFFVCTRSHMVEGRGSRGRSFPFYSLTWWFNLLKSRLATGSTGLEVGAVWGSTWNLDLFEFFHLFKTWTLAYNNVLSRNPFLGLCIPLERVFQALTSVAGIVSPRIQRKICVPHGSATDPSTKPRIEKSDPMFSVLWQFL